MALRYYRNGPARQLAFPIALSSDTAMTVDSASGFPTQYPYTLIIEPDTALEEVVDVTAAVGNVLTITRGVDSTTASAHAAGSVVYHGISARDPREANAHVNATTNVHGTTGSLVDTDSAQTIVGAKNFTGGLTTPTGAVVTVGGTQTITGAKNFDVTPTTTTNGEMATLGGAQAFTGTKTFQNTVQNGTEDHNGAEDHSGTEVHSGTETHSGLMRLSHATMQAVFTSSTADDSTTSVAFVAGSNPVGAAFVVPPSGKVFVTWSVLMQQAIDGQASICTIVIRAGGSVGSGSTIVAGSSDRAITCGRAVNTGSPAILQASRRTLISGLTPGDTCNARIEFATDSGGNTALFFRELIVEPHL